HASLEAQVAALADDIAYDNHDIDDGLRSGFLDLDELLELDLVAANFRAIERRFPGQPREALQRELVRDQIGLMVNDVLETTRTNVAGVASVQEVRSAGRQLAAFSPAMAAYERELKAFLYRRLYYHEEQLVTAERAQHVVAKLFAAYHREPALLPEGWLQALPSPLRLHRWDDRPVRNRTLSADLWRNAGRPFQCLSLAAFCLPEPPVWSARA